MAGVFFLDLKVFFLYLSTFLTHTLLITMEHKIFEYAVFYQPSKEETEAGQKPEILIKPDVMLATKEENALVHISRQIPEDFLEKLDNVKIVVRPF